MPAKKNKLEIFVDEYMKDFNGTRAAISAGYSARSASSTASDLLRNPKVQKAIDYRKAQRSERLELSTDKIVEEMAQIGFEKNWSLRSKGVGTKLRALELLYTHVKTTKEFQPQSFVDLIKQIALEPDDDSK